MEPITTTVVTALLWENLAQPLLDKVKDTYADNVFDSVKGMISKLPFKKEENEVIEVEIIDGVKSEQIKDKDTFIKFIENNPNFNLALALENLKKVKSDVEINDSFQRLSKSKIGLEAEGKTASINNSFQDIDGSEISIKL